MNKFVLCIAAALALLFAVECSAKVLTVSPILINVYEKPSTSSRLLRKLRHGTTVNALSSVNGWTMLDDGYVRTQYLVPFSVAQQSTAQEYFVNTENAQTYTGPGKNYSVSRKLLLHQPLTLEDHVSGWGKIKGANDWIALEYLTKVKASTPSATTIGAYTFSGKKNTVPSKQQDNNKPYDPNKIQSVSDKGVPPEVDLSLDYAPTRNSYARQSKGVSYVPELIVCHTTESSFADALQWYTNANSRYACHFLVGKDGRIVQLVDVGRAAWCQGTSVLDAADNYYGKSTSSLVKEKRTNANFYTVGIQFEGTSKNGGILTDAQLRAGAKLVQHIRREVYEHYHAVIPLDRAHVIGHSEVTPVAHPDCPGAKFPFAKLIELAKDL